MLRSAYGTRAPAGLLGVVKFVWRTSYGIHLAVGVRLLLGAALVVSAPGA